MDAFLHLPPGNSLFDIELTLKLLHTALSVDVLHQTSSTHWVLGCSPFPLLYILAQLLNQTLRFVKELSNLHCYYIILEYY